MPSQNLLIKNEGEITEQTSKFVDELKALCADNLVEIKNPKSRRIFVRVKKDFLKECIIQAAKEMNITHISTITGIDLGAEGIEILYHFAFNDSIAITIGSTVPKDNLSVQTISDFIPGAVLYEQEVHEMLGVNFEGHPNLGVLFLPEGWPTGVFPMRKGQRFEDLKKIKIQETGRET